MRHYDQNKKYYRLLSNDYHAIKGQIYSEGDKLNYAERLYVKDMAEIYAKKDWEEVKFVDGKWVEANQKTYTLEEIESALRCYIDYVLAPERARLIDGKDGFDKAKCLVTELKNYLNK